MAVSPIIGSSHSSSSAKNRLRKYNASKNHSVNYFFLRFSPKNKNTPKRLVHLLLGMFSNFRASQERFDFTIYFLTKKLIYPTISSRNLSHYPIQSLILLKTFQDHSYTTYYLSHHQSFPDKILT